MTPIERASEAVQSWYAENTWGYDPVQHAKLEKHLAAAIKEAMDEQKEKDAKIAESWPSCDNNTCRNPCVSQWIAGDIRLQDLREYQ